jgi:nucleotide-binding universal stress UspA family protein
MLEDIMVVFKKILVPVDFSDASKEAVNYGLSLALQHNGQLALAHIVPVSAGLFSTNPSDQFAVEREQARKAESELPLLVPEQFRERVRLRTIVKVGPVKEDIIDIVNDEKIELVVMGTHGRKAFERFFLGSVTERMLRKIPVPILTVSRANAADGLQSAMPVRLRNVLYATDLSDNADVGLRIALDLSREAGARLTVLHVLQAVETIYWGAEGGYLKQDLDDLRESTYKRLIASIPEECCQDVNVKPLMVEGDPFHEILRVADDGSTDLIVLNLHGRGFVERALLGSTAERVVRCAHVPVLSIPVPAEYGARLASATGTAA